MVADGAFNHKIDCVQFFFEFVNFKGQLNCTDGSKVTAVLLNGWILPIGGALAVEGLQSTRLPRLVLMCHHGSK